jgi:integrase
MPSSWILTRTTKEGRKRYRVLYRLGGRESRQRYAGSFSTRAEALARKKWVDGELAALRVPQIEFLEPTPATTFAEVAERWRQSRIDVADGTAQTHRINLSRILPTVGELPIDRVDVAAVADLVAALHKRGLARESIRKTRATLAMVLDFAGVQPNPARDRSVKLPREEVDELVPPTAAHVEAVLRLLPNAYRLPTVVLDATGMRVGELEALEWGDVDEPDGRWRIRRGVAKTGRARWVPVPPAVFGVVIDLVPREDRDTAAQVFAGFGADRFRTSLTRACKAAGVPVFSPHDLRHRRATLWHLSGVPIVEAASWLGHSPQEHLKTYAHATLLDRREVFYSAVDRRLGDEIGANT